MYTEKGYIHGSRVKLSKIFTLFRSRRLCTMIRMVDVSFDIDVTVMTRSHSMSVIPQ